MKDVNERAKKSAPEFSFYHKVRAFFAEDQDIEVGDIDEINYEFTITVRDSRKCDILERVLHVPEYARRLTMNIEYDRGYFAGVSEEDLAYLLKDNQYFSEYVDEKSENGLIPSATKYIMMKPTVIQYYDDIFNNPYGYDTKTAEQLAKELFHGSKCNITSNIEKLIKAQNRK